MKKVLLTLILVFTTTSVFSQKIKVESGSIDFLKTEQSIKVAFTYNDMKVGKKEEAVYVKEKIDKQNKDAYGSGDTWHKRWINDRADRFEPKFIELFNKRMSEKNGALIGEEGDYLMTVNTHHTEPGFNVAVARKNAEVSLTCTFTHIPTGEEVAVVSVKKASANNFWGDDFDVAYRIQESYAKAGRELAKHFVKQLKLN
ncbi:MAG: hypothetical protein E6767_12060 [Dysgonomonas sp.]|nr:hypothetical protein [Dysgonomonas sp.]